MHDHVKSTAPRCGAVDTWRALRTMERRDFLKSTGALGAVAGVSGLGLIASTGSSVAASFSITDPNPVTSDDGTIELVNVVANFTVNWDGFDEGVYYAAYRDEVVVAPNGVNERYTIYDGIGEVSAGSTGPALAKLGDGETAGSDSDDSWGGDTGPDGGEYYSPEGQTQGFIHADIDWNVLHKDGDASYTFDTSDDPNANSVEDPAPADELFADTDGAQNKTTVEYVKTVRLYGESSPSDSTADPVPLTGPNGPWGLSDPVGEDSFIVDITNQTAQTSGSGSGDATVTK